MRKRIWHTVRAGYEIVKRSTFLRIIGLFLVKYRFLGYGKYAKIKRKFGADCVICSSALIGTGDYYFCGMYLKTWLEKNNITNYVFNVPAPQFLRIVKLFDYVVPHVYNIGDNWFLNGLKAFLLRQYPIDHNYFLHVGGGACNRGFLEMAPYVSQLLGYRNLNILDFYLLMGFNLPRDTVPESPKFSNDADALDKLISSVGAIRERTVLISPYAASYGNLTPRFWNKIVKGLKQRGYCVVTNVGIHQQPLKGTKALFLPYEQSVPFLDFAGNFIGMRSGLCDIISTSSCKKVVIYPYYAINWPNGTSLGFVGMKKMGICNDAVELELTEHHANEGKTIRKILKEFL